MKTPILETQRLILRPISLDDAPAIQKHFNNWEIIQNLSMQVPWPYPDDGAETFIRDSVLPRIAEKGNMIWVLVSKFGSDEAIGIIDFGQNETKHGDRGFWIAEEFQGQGLMSEAVVCVNDFLFFELGLEKFRVTNAKNNEASRKVKQKTGAQFIGMQKLKHHNGEEESEIWEVTRENWARIRDKT
ncbi:MAG: GNAT family N-acetyltransferase [Rhodospirillales bacterium]|nr:GNAT family N-acetyltransferase [Rhodospirillales bacterium]